MDKYEKEKKKSGIKMPSLSHKREENVYKRN